MKLKFYLVEIVKKVRTLETVKKVRTQYNKYIVDDTAEREGHTVLRLPPYHCNLNRTDMESG
jgi:hypothetical protein